MTNQSSQKNIASEYHSKTNDFILTLDTISQNDIPTFISNKRITSISRFNSFKVEKIDYNFLHGDGLLSNFISVEKVKLPYRPYLKCPKEFNCGKTATSSSPTFIGEYGTESIIVFIPTPIWDYIIKGVINDLEDRTDIIKELGWENRFREQYIKA